jgi:hypothetical protein
MGFCDEYRCDRCGVVQSVSTLTLRDYVLENSERIPCGAKLGWCDTCKSLVAMERIYPLQVMVKVLTDLEDSDPNDEMNIEAARLYHVTPEEHLAERIDTVRKDVAWRRNRKSPPRCLECGSIEVAPVEDEPERVAEFEHPGCGGLFRHQTTYHFIEAAVQLYSAEGERKTSALT